MVVVMEPSAPEGAIEAVIAYLVGAGLEVHRSSGQTRTLLGVVGEVTETHLAVARDFEWVSDVVRVSEPFRLASRRFREASTVVEGPWGIIGGERPWIAIEPVGGADRTGESDPPSADLRYEIAAGRPFDAAVTRARVVPDNVGALTCVSLHPDAEGPEIRFVERGPSWGANKWIGVAEKELARREGAVVLLEAGGEYPNGARTLEVAAIARAKIRTHLPLVVDVPSIAQRARYTTAVAGAAIGSGADGVILRVWVGKNGEPCPVPATLRWEEAVRLAEKLRAVGAAVRR